MKYTKELLEPIVESSKSFAEMLRKLGLKQTGGTQSHLRQCIKNLEIDTSHFTGQGHRRGKTFGFSYPIEEYLSNRRYIKSSGLRNRLFKDGIKKRQCEKCNLSDWMGEELSLELHHIDCDHDNNSLDNLQIVCPNCHYVIHLQLRRIDKDMRDKQKQARRLEIKNSAKSSNRYKKMRQRKVDRPPYDQLLQEIYDTNYSAVGRKYGVSDNAIRKWVKSYEKNSPVQIRTENLLVLSETPLAVGLQDRV